MIAKEDWTIGGDESADRCEERRGSPSPARGRVVDNISM